MSVNDEEGRVYVNVKGDGFGNAEEMRLISQHDGGHGTYKDRDIDEKAAERIGTIRAPANKTRKSPVKE